MPETPTQKPVRLSIDVPEELHMRFRLQCIERRENMKDVMLRLLAEHMKQTEKSSS